MKKITLFIACCIIHAGIYAQTDWHIKGNTGINSSTNFIGTKDTAAFKIRTNNIVRMTINAAGNVGIGTADPLNKFHVDGTGILARFGTGTTSANSNYSIIDNTLGCYIEQRGNTATVGSDYLVLQSSKDGNKVDYSQFYNSPKYGFAFLSLANGNNNVGIGAFSPQYRLYVVANYGIHLPVAYIENTQGSSGAEGLYIKAGSNIATGANYIAFLRPDGTNTGLIQQTSINGITYASTSDKRLKNIIGTSQKGLADLMKIKIYDYTFKSDPEKKVQTGFMAQELYDIFPQAISKPRETNEPAEKNPWMVDYGRVTPLIIKAVQELSHQNDELKSEIQKLKSEMQKQIDELKALLISKSKENTIALNQTASNQ